MSRARKSTIDAFVDQFCEFDLDRQAHALDLMQFEHRRAQIRARKTSAESKPAPRDSLVTEGSVMDDSPRAGQPNNGMLVFDPALPKAAKSIP